MLVLVRPEEHTTLVSQERVVLDVVPSAVLDIDAASLLAVAGLPTAGEEVATEEAMADEPVDAEAVDVAGEELAGEEAVGEEALFTDEAGTDEAGDAADAAAEQEAVQPEPVEEFVAPAPAPQVVTSEPSDPLSQLLNNPMLLAAAGGGLLLAVALLGLIMKRRKAAVEAETETAPAMPTSGSDLESLADDVASVTESEAAEEAAEAILTTWGYLEE